MDTFTLDNVVLYSVVTGEKNERPIKTRLYTGPMSCFMQDGNDDNDDNADDVLCLECGDSFLYPVAGQQFERFENGLFMCPADNDVENEAEAAELPNFKMYGFKLSVDSEEDAEGQSSKAATAFQELLVANALFTDRRKCYAAKKVDEGTRVVSGGISSAASMFGQGVASGSSFLKSKIKKSGKDVDLTKTKKAVHTVKKYTGKAASVTQCVSGVVIKKSVETGHYVGDKINHISYVERLKERRRKAAEAKRGKPLSKMDKFMKGATEVVVAFGSGGLSLFVVLNEAADVILDDSIAAVGDVVEHKFGEDAGEIVEDTLGIGLDGVKIYKTGSKGAKTLAKGMAQDAALQGGGTLVMDALDDGVGGKESDGGGKTKK